MNFLTLCQRLVTECGVSGTFSTTISQTGEFARIVNWVSQGWTELQTKHNDWNWMRSSQILGGGAGMSFATVNADATYPLGTGAGTCGILEANFSRWDKETFRCFTTSLGATGDEMFLDEVDYDVWRDAYMLGALRSVTTRPYVFAIAPDETVCLGPPPNALYTITGDYFRAPTAMAVDADIPTGLPVSHHLAIVYKAMEYYGAYEAASEVYQRGASGYKKLTRELETLKMVEVRAGGALA